MCDAPAAQHCTSTCCAIAVAGDMVHMYVRALDGAHTEVNVEGHMAWRDVLEEIAKKPGWEWAGEKDCVRVVLQYFKLEPIPEDEEPCNAFADDVSNGYRLVSGGATVIINLDERTDACQYILNDGTILLVRKNPERSETK